MKVNKVCMFCVHFYFDSGSPRWSEMTPGTDWEMGCGIGIWEMDRYPYITQEEFIKMLNSTCEKWGGRKIETH